MWPFDQPRDKYRVTTVNGADHWFVRDYKTGHEIGPCASLDDAIDRITICDRDKERADKAKRDLFRELDRLIRGKSMRYVAFDAIDMRELRTEQMKLTPENIHYLYQKYGLTK